MNGEKDEIMTKEEDGEMETEFMESPTADGTGQNKAASETKQAEHQKDSRDASCCPADRRSAPLSEGDSSADAGDGDAAAELRAALNRAEERVTQLERERALLSQGIPEEDLDYYVFKIGKLATGGKDFDTAAREFLKQHGAAHRAPTPHSTGASLAGRAPSPRSTNDTMNRILRGN